MKKFLYVFIFSSLLIGNIFSARAAFVEGLEDIPLPDGLNQIENGNLNFGNEEIRLIEAYLSSQTLLFEQVADFYKQTLPQMGWQIKKQFKRKILFEREGETLEISEEALNPLIVRLTVKSKL